MVYFYLLVSISCDFFYGGRYEKAVVAMAKQQVTLEVLSYHATAPVEDAVKLRVNYPFCYFEFKLSELIQH